MNQNRSRFQALAAIVVLVFGGLVACGLPFLPSKPGPSLQIAIPPGLRSKAILDVYNGLTPTFMARARLVEANPVDPTTPRTYEVEEDFSAESEVLELSLTQVAFGTYNLEVSLVDTSSDPGAAIILYQAMGNVAVTSEELITSLSLDRVTAQIDGLMVLDGNPLGGVTISGLGEVAVITDSEGKFSTPAIPTGIYTLSFSSGDTMMSLPLPRRIVIKDGNQVNYTFSVGYGSIMGSTSPPSSGVHVILQGTEYSTNTDTFGTWAFNNLPEGVYTVVYGKPGFGFDPNNVEVTLGAGITEELSTSILANPYTLSFDPNGGDAPSFGTKAVAGGGTYGTFPTVIRTGYSLTGWFDMASGGTKVQEADDLLVQADHTLYAQWTANQYTVIFDALGGTPTPDPKMVTFDGPYGTLPVVTWPGYSFDGWFTGESGGTQITPATVVSVDEDHIVYAHWTPETYTVTFNSNGGSAPSSSTMVVTAGGVYGTMPTTNRDGYTFDGWYSASTGGSKYNTGSSLYQLGNHTLYAQWIALQYNVFLNPVGGSVAPSSILVTYGTTYGSLPIPSKAGYTFAGWWTASAGTGNQRFDSTPVSILEDETLYAYWLDSFTFTNAGKTGSNGPSQAQVDSAYTGTSLAGMVTVTGTGIQQWTVPVSGTYRIEVSGAKGANGSGMTGGLGAIMRGTFTLTGTEVLQILVGQMGTGDGGSQSGGGGGSFVVRTPYNTLGSVLIAAGGGGGAADAVADVASRHATTASSGQNGYQTPGVNDSQYGVGGVDGNGATNFSTNPHAGNGGGFLTAGAASAMGSGTSFIAGGAGGGTTGGFGGGGAAGNSGGGGGGGYSGGGGTYHYPTAGGGGGSINNGIDQDNSGSNDTHGVVVITYLGP